MATVTPLLGVMEMDFRAATWKDIGDLTLTWLQDAGGFAAVGLLLWTIYVMLTPSPAIAGGGRKLISRFMAVTGLLALVVYLVALGLTVAAQMERQRLYEEQGLGEEQRQQVEKQQAQLGKFAPKTKMEQWQGYALAGAGLLALLAFCEPFFLDLFRLRARRVFALAKLSFKEAIRKRVVWVFLLILLVILFPAAWFTPRGSKPENALKTSIDVITFAMTVLLVATALLLAGFSIPTDVKNQTIHTVVTKPTERFEIVLGRFLGYLTLVTIALVIQTAVCLLFIRTSNVGQAAREESMKARVPVYGSLEFSRERGRGAQLERQQFEGIDVGREYSYRRYIAGGEKSPHRAVWSFIEPDELRAVADLPVVPLEFAFDVYRTTKGEENRGVQCSFELTTWKWEPAREDEYFRRLNAANAIQDPDAQMKAFNALAEEFGRFDRKNYSVNDYHTYTLFVPPALVKNALSGKPGDDSPLKSEYGTPYLQIKVKCESASQFIGVAPLDLYFLESEGSFYLNFFKGIVGLWCRLAIVIGLAVAASTYLAGVVSFLAALFLFLAGYFQSFLRELASGLNVGGGPFESFTRLVKGQTSAGELDKTPTVQAALLGDDVFRWLLRRILNIIPDTERFTWSEYLKQGFNIPGDFMLLNLLFLAAYMLPWFVLAYYLMRSREIAA